MRLLAFSAILLLIIIAITQDSPKEQVYEACQDSRMTNRTTEEECGRLQDKYNIEYLCKEANRSATNECWVEQK